MKKSFLIAAAAIILASCANETLLNSIKDSKQEPIGFKSYSEKPVKSTNNPSDLEYYHSTFVVYGSQQNKVTTTDIQYIFGGVATAAGVQKGDTCYYQDENLNPVLGDWRYDSPRFWDKQCTYNFIAYAPASTGNPLRYYYGAEKALVGADGNEFKTSTPYILRGTNLQEVATRAEKVKGFTANAGDLDLMISGSIPQDGNAHDAYVSLVFRHILSKLNVTFTKAQSLQDHEVTITGVEIAGLKDKGEYSESLYENTDTTKVSGWTATNSDANPAYKLVYNPAVGQVLENGTVSGSTFTPAAPYYAIESLIIPQDIADNQVTLTVNYTVGTFNPNHTYTLDLYDVAALRKFFDGYNYTLNFTIDLEMIRFDASAAAWADRSVNAYVNE